ncbi:hypothetical protein Q0V21_04970 [Paenibacillus sp. 11B]|uniref:hypothetical protein n=1 Tax=Paenibacillus sp. 11B TaxID=3060965 RepID=UPI00264C881B|nr:hypothetical protein [Paenibacillus sp. 11B]MDN8588119.1 hypothetical protein [Paenibacillus sp. 11B]
MFFTNGKLQSFEKLMRQTPRKHRPSSEDKPNQQPQVTPSQESPSQLKEQTTSGDQ